MKIYFAGADGVRFIRPLLTVGVKYALTSYEAWNNKGNNHSDLFNSLPYNEFESVIVDSGLFSYLWGKKAHIEYDKNFYYTYLDNYCKFIERSKFENMRYVELDVQEKLGVDFAWELRDKLVGRFDKNKIINVVHVVDGDPTNLIVYADYLAVSVTPTIKKYGKEYYYKYINFIYKKALTSNTKIHLFGVTRPDDVTLCYGATSCDSTSWLAQVKWGNFKGHNYFYGKGGCLDVRSRDEVIALMSDIERGMGTRFAGIPSERQFLYAAYTAFLYYQNIDPNTVN
mgnify:CR=1 FL=1